MPERLGFGVVGCGSAAVPVCAALRDSPAAALAAVYDRDLADRKSVV